MTLKQKIGMIYSRSSEPIRFSIYFYSLSIEFVAWSNNITVGQMIDRLIPFQNFVRGRCH